MTLGSSNVALNASGWKLAPCARYVISDSLFRTICSSLEAQQLKDFVRSWSCFNSYERRYAGQDLNGRRLAVYRENGQGDNLMVSGLLGYIKYLYPKATIDIYGLPDVGPVWAGNTDANFLDIAPPFDSLRNAYDYHLLFEGMLENNNEPDQANGYDSFLQFSGFSPKDVPSEFKRPRVFWTPGDEQSEAEWLQLRPAGDYVLLHWNPSGRTRQYPFEQMRQLIRLLADRFNVVVVGYVSGDVEPLNVAHPNVFDWMNKTPSIRSFLPMIKHAKAVICPDSCIMHLAPCFPDVPCVALYGSFSHHDRSLYYPNVTPLDAFETCPSAPCHAGKNEFPVSRCGQAKGYVEGQTFCQALANIAPERILETVLKLTR